MRFFLILIMVINLHLQAKSIESKVYAIDYSPGEGLPHLVLLENGTVIFLEAHNQKALDVFKNNLERHDKLLITVDDGHEFHDFIASLTLSDYRPTILTSGSRSSEIFSRMRGDYQTESQCYNRAHVWAWEEFYYEGLKSKKHFLFFTSRYIRNYRYRWWFHVAPSVYVAGVGEQILDRRYASRPLGIKEWLQKFIFSGRTCPVVQRYSQYRDHQESEDCYLLPVPMYYWQPKDIEWRDRTGDEKTSFLGRELDIAYGEAF